MGEQIPQRPMQRQRGHLHLDGRLHAVFARAAGTGGRQRLEPGQSGLDERTHPAHPGRGAVLLLQGEQAGSDDRVLGFVAGAGAAEAAATVEDVSKFTRLRRPRVVAVDGAGEAATDVVQGVEGLHERGGGVPLDGRRIRKGGHRGGGHSGVARLQQGVDEVAPAGVAVTIDDEQVRRVVVSFSERQLSGDPLGASLHVTCVEPEGEAGRVKLLPGLLEVVVDNPGQGGVGLGGVADQHRRLHASRKSLAENRSGRFGGATLCTARPVRKGETRDRPKKMLEGWRKWI